MKSFMVLLFIILPSVVYAGNLDNQVSLADLKSVKIVCDVNVGKPELLLRRLELIDETYTQLLDANVTPTVVVAFRGEASRYITRDAMYVAPETVDTKKEIQGWIDQFRQNGLRVEQCAIAARANNIDPVDFLPGVVVVKNGYVSIVAYQARGYALLPMD